MELHARITPFLWFDNCAEEAVTFYASVFPGARIVERSTYLAGGPGPAGALLSATIEIEGQQLIAFNAGPNFPKFEFSTALSLFISCDTQQEVDHFWARLPEGGGRTLQCGWLRDRFGVSWQVVPRALGRLLRDPDRARSQRAMQAMLQMTKLDIARLEQA
jgi:predicted 3-demethylubiquinone-9 3-methyltransferase (glyoxalase superfamily)